MKLISHIEGYFSSRIDMAVKLFALFKLEARLAELNVFPFLLGMALLIPLLLTLWLFIMVLLGYLVFMLTTKILWAISLIIVLNILFVGLAVSDLKRRLRYMSFIRTRDCLSHESTEKSLTTSNH